MALRDYYQEGAEDADAAAAAGKKKNGDDWALAYINVSRYVGSTMHAFSFARETKFYKASANQRSF